MAVILEIPQRKFICSFFKLQRKHANEIKGFCQKKSEKVTKKVKKDNQIPFVASMGVFLEIPQRK